MTTQISNKLKEIYSKLLNCVTESATDKYMISEEAKQIFTHKTLLPSLVSHLENNHKTNKFANCVLGVIYSNSFVCDLSAIIKPDAIKSDAHFKKSVQLGFYDAYVPWAFLYSPELYKDSKRMISILSEGMSKNNMECYYWLGAINLQIYIVLPGCKTDAKKGLGLILISAYSGSLQAINDISENMQYYDTLSDINYGKLFELAVNTPQTEDNDVILEDIIDRLAKKLKLSFGSLYMKYLTILNKNKKLTEELDKMNEHIRYVAEHDNAKN